MDNRNFKENIKTAAAYLAEHGVEVSHSRLLEAMSRAFGERNWSTLSSQLKAGSVKEAPVANTAWDPSQGPMSQAQYVAGGGNRCPFCGSTDIEADGPEADGPRTWDNNTCHHCGSTWNASYSLSGYYNPVQGNTVRTVEGHKLLLQLGAESEVVLCGLSEDRQNWLGYVFSASQALSVLAETVLEKLSTADTVVIEDFDEQTALERVLAADIRPRLVFTKFDEPSARAAAENACSHQVNIETCRDDVVEDIWDDVTARARKQEFSHYGFENALNLARESVQALGLDATDAEVTQAARRLS